MRLHFVENDANRFFQTIVDLFHSHRKVAGSSERESVIEIYLAKKKASGQLKADPDRSTKEIYLAEYAEGLGKKAVNSRSSCLMYSQWKCHCGVLSDSVPAWRGLRLATSFELAYYALRAPRRGGLFLPDFCRREHDAEPSFVRTIGPREFGKDLGPNPPGSQDAFHHP